MLTLVGGKAGAFDAGEKVNVTGRVTGSDQPTVRVDSIERAANE